MIPFIRDNLAPEELCRLLTQTVPERYHVPVVFTTRRTDDFASIKPGYYPMGYTNLKRVVINLSKIWSVPLRGRPAATETQVWYQVLYTCYHEFGHIATYSEWESSGSYDHDDRAHRRAEDLADRWAYRQILDLADHDARLAQPRTLGGYCGARLARLKASCREWGDKHGWGGARATSLRDWRCYKSGGQLSAGDVIKRLRLRQYRNPYGWLRKVSGDLGVVYTDGAGRNHRLYYWGDLLTLAQRLTALIRSGRMKKAEGKWFLHDDTELPFKRRRRYPMPSQDVLDPSPAICRKNAVLRPRSGLEVRADR
jgi:hypothetical protein